MSTDSTEKWVPRGIFAGGLVGICVWVAGKTNVDFFGCFFGGLMLGWAGSLVPALLEDFIESEGVMRGIFFTFLSLLAFGAFYVGLKYIGLILSIVFATFALTCLVLLSRDLFFSLKKLDKSKAKFPGAKVGFVCIIVLVFAFLGLLNQYTEIVRFAVGFGSLYFVALAWEKRDFVAIVVFGILGIIFNPIFPVYLHDSRAWRVVDIYSSTAFLIYSLKPEYVSREK